jgi:endonuclease-3 related protein
MMLYVFSRRTFVADTYARRLFAFLGFDAPDGYPAFHKAYAPVVLDTGLDVADLQEFHGLIDEFGKAYRDDAAKNESFLQSWRPGEAAPRPTE